MTKAKAVENGKAMKAAAKKIAPVPKHIPRSESDGVDYDPAQKAGQGGTAPWGKSPLRGRAGTSLAGSPVGQSVVDSAQTEEADMQAIQAGRRASDPVVMQATVKDQAANSQGADGVVESGFSIFNQRAGAPDMTDQTTETSKIPDLKRSEAAEAKKKELEARVAEKAAKKAEAEKKKAAQIEEIAARKAEREAKAAESKAARDAKAEELKAAGKGYIGSMLSLADRVKAGVYVKGMTGQLRSSDELAVTLDAVPPANVIKLGLAALKLDVNPYAHLNVGQQSMNLRNKMRGAIKAGTLTLEQVKEIRDKDGLATAEAEITAKKEAKAAREAKAASEKAAKAAKQAEANAKAQIAAEPAKETERAPISEQATQVKSVSKKEKAVKA